MKKIVANNNQPRKIIEYLEENKDLTYKEAEKLREYDEACYDLYREESVKEYGLKLAKIFYRLPKAKYVLFSCCDFTYNTDYIFRFDDEFNPQKGHCKCSVIKIVEPADRNIKQYYKRRLFGVPIFFDYISWNVEQDYPMNGVSIYRLLNDSDSIIALDDEYGDKVFNLDVNFILNDRLRYERKYKENIEYYCELPNGYER